MLFFNNLYLRCLLVHVDLNRHRDYLLLLYLLPYSDDKFNLMLVGLLDR